MVVPGLSSNCGTSASSTSPSQDSSSTPSSTPSSPASERSDELAPGNGSRETPQGIRVGFRMTRLRDLPEWSEEFTENLGDTEVPAYAHISRTVPFSSHHPVLSSRSLAVAMTILVDLEVRINNLVSCFSIVWY